MQPLSPSNSLGRGAVCIDAGVPVRGRAGCQCGGRGSFAWPHQNPPKHRLPCSSLAGRCPSGLGKASATHQGIPRVRRGTGVCSLPGKHAPCCRSASLRWGGELQFCGSPRASPAFAPRGIRRAAGIRQCNKVTMKHPRPFTLPHFL